MAAFDPATSVDPAQPGETRTLPVAKADLRYGHDLSQVQDENGVDLSLLLANLALTVEERLLALQDFVEFADNLSRGSQAR